MPIGAAKEAQSPIHLGAGNLVAVTWWFVRCFCSVGLLDFISRLQRFVISIDADESSAEECGVLCAWVRPLVQSSPQPTGCQAQLAAAADFSLICSDQALT